MTQPCWDNSSSRIWGCLHSTSGTAAVYDRNVYSAVLGYERVVMDLERTKLQSHRIAAQQEGWTSRQDANIMALRLRACSTALGLGPKLAMLKAAASSARK